MELKPAPVDKKIWVKEENIVCSFCNKVTWVKVHEEEIEVWEHQLLYGEICEDCKQLIAEWVTLRCMGSAWEVEKDGEKIQVPCMTVTVVTKEVLEKYGFVEWEDFELGGYIDVSFCPMCSEDKKFHFTKQ